MFDHTTLKWQHGKTIGEIPKEVSAAAYTMNKNVLYFFGGYLGNGRVNSFVKLDLASLKWSSVHQNIVPEPRIRAKMVVLDEVNLILYGGKDTTGRILTDLHIFSIKNGEYVIHI